MAALFHILASRPRPIKSIRVTGVGPNFDLLEDTGRRLSDFAAGLASQGKIADLAPLQRRHPAEATVVHWTQHCLYDVTGSDVAAAQFLKSLRPCLITIVEQDLCHGGDFLGRFVEALHYYSALFDAIGDGVGGGRRGGRWRGGFGGRDKEHTGGRRAEEDREVTVEGWGDELRRVGFRQVSLAGSPAAQANLLLGMGPWKGYTLMEEDGMLKLGWKDLSLLTASAWRPADGAGEVEVDADEADWDRCDRVSL
ncbi:Scarecrow-like protein 23 [Platanthera zijinensis]|uniref:Scarecrow-like protein 23 n=1 Tax=Platanthera zijinensis TaxID=2320716 RepID=A0AAP0GA45_9ASPA